MSLALLKTAFVNSGDLSNEIVTYSANRQPPIPELWNAEAVILRSQQAEVTPTLLTIRMEPSLQSQSPRVAVFLSRDSRQSAQVLNSKKQASTLRQQLRMLLKNQERCLTEQ
jgi:hypothetical protein